MPIYFILFNQFYQAISSYCLKCRNNTEANTIKGKLKLNLLNYVVCDCKKFKFIEKQEA